MNPSLIDPNNHVPDVSPHDDWEDAHVLLPSAQPTGSALPPRRVNAERAPAETEFPDRVGLRIDAQISRCEPSENPQRLEVQEINGSVIRLESAAPPPPKVPRQVTFHERPAQLDPTNKPGGESRQWGNSTGRHPARWIIAAGVVVCAVVVSGMLVLPSINATNAPRPISAENAFAPILEDKIAGVEALNFLLNKQPEALQIYRSYATARDVDEMLPVIRDGMALASVLRERWHPQEISGQWSPDPESKWSVVLLAGRACGVLEGNLPDHSEFRAVFTYDHDRLLLDWMATSGYGTATFQDLLAGRGDAAEIRGQIGPTEFYSATYPEADFRSYRLVSPRGEESVWCYTRRGTVEDATLAPLFDKGVIVGEASTSRKVTLRLDRGPEGSLPNQWLVAEVLHEDWVKP